MDNNLKETQELQEAMDEKPGTHKLSGNGFAN